MVKFKVGDNVRVVYKPDVYAFGRVGKVVQISSTWGYRVQYSDNLYDYDWWSQDSSLELVNEKESEVFYMVKREGEGATQVRHFTEKSAYEEAKRLAKKHPGVKFYVLKAVGYVHLELPEPKKVEL